jgi:hypothetical protein
MSVTEGLHFEDWAAAYGSPYLIDEEAPGEDAPLVEPLEPFARTPQVDPVTELAFVDGVRRIEGLVYHRYASGALARGVVGAHASGAVMIDGPSRPVFHRIRTRRLLVFGSGHSEELARMPGYEWETHSVRETDPEAPVRSLQDRMRMAEARLAEELALEGWLTLVDGPIYNVRTLDQPVLGYKPVSTSRGLLFRQTEVDHSVNAARQRSRRAGRGYSRVRLPRLARNSRLIRQPARS